MSTSAKIRILLALLCASLLLTAIVVQKTYTPQNNLKQTAHILEKNLHQKEAFVNKIINNSTDWKTIENLSQDANSDLKWIEQLTTNRRIWLLTYKSNKLVFWTGVKVIPQHPEFIKEGRSFLKESNGYYEAIKKTAGDFEAIFFIPVKSEYTFQNQYLQNVFDQDLLADKNIDLADFTDREVYSIYSIDHKYLFSVKLNSTKLNSQFYSFEVTIWVLAFLCCCVLINSISNYIARKKHLLLSLLFLACFIVLLRFVNLYFQWPYLSNTFGLFNPDYFHSGRLLPSLGDFCINILMLFWLAGFLFNYRFRLARPVSNKATGYIIVIAAAALLLFTAGILHNLFRHLVVQSNISFDVNNVLNLSRYSLTGILMLGFAFLIFILLNETLLVICSKVAIPLRHKFIILALGVIIASVITFLTEKGSTFYIMAGLLIGIRAYAIQFKQGVLSAISIVAIVFICAFISATNLNYFETIKEHGNRIVLLDKLQAGGDVGAENLFVRVERQIVKDTIFINSLSGTSRNDEYLKTHIQKIYLDGYLSKYDCKIYEFDRNGKSLTNDKRFTLDDFKYMVIYNSVSKITGYFYRENKTFGSLHYFAILPIYQNNELLGTFVFDLKSQPLEYSGTFPEILLEGRFENVNPFKGYSYAFYEDGMLMSQRGDYTYSLVNNEFKPKLKQYVFVNKEVANDHWWQHFTTYSHLIYQPTSRRIIVISKKEYPIIESLTSLTFFFVTLLAFDVILLILRWLWDRLDIYSVDHGYLPWRIRLDLEGVLYKTRIQFSMVFSVVLTLILVGVVTYVSISNQYQGQQDYVIKEKARQIAEAFENNYNNIDITKISEENQVWFNDFAKGYSADITLYNREGVPVLTTQPRIYRDGLLARRMNGKAFLLLDKLHKSEFVNEETIGTLKYKAAYASLRTADNSTTIGFLQLPYFSNQSDYKEYIGSLLNAMINIYALIFLAIGLFAIIIARQITNPLSIIQYNLSKTTWGSKNEPIKWERNDEIGALVKAYNKMISELAESARKLAQSERENAWREMAKQVAHEIKNPLTPLKLGLQLLEKSWKDKDPKFDQKFERFSKSFVEQIESLSSIASEFSAFAKMPETRIERLNVFDTINQATTIFRQTNNLTINYQSPDQPFYINADRDQLLRCFNNLLKNAIEAMPQDKQGDITIDYTISAKNILITIKDNGKGIPENLRDRIFEPNFTTKSSGTGLGLAFVKNSIENAGGKVWYETVINEGTTFYLSLPMVG